MKLSLALLASAVPAVLGVSSVLVPLYSYPDPKTCWPELQQAAYVQRSSTSPHLGPRSSLITHSPVLLGGEPVGDI